MLQQLVMRAGLDHRAIFQNDNPVGIQNGRQPVGDCDDRSAATGPLQSLLDFVLRFAVECAGGFVKKQDRRVLQQRAGDADTLLLPAGELQPAFTDTGVILIRK